MTPYYTHVHVCICTTYGCLRVWHTTYFLNGGRILCLVLCENMLYVRMRVEEVCVCFLLQATLPRPLCKFHVHTWTETLVYACVFACAYCASSSLCFTQFFYSSEHIWRASWQEWQPSSSFLCVFSWLA